MKSHSQSGDGTKDLDQELKLLLGVLPLRLDLLLSEDSKSSRNLKGQETCGAREGLEHKRWPLETWTGERPSPLKHPAQTHWHNSLAIPITNTKDPAVEERDGFSATAPQESKQRWDSTRLSVRLTFKTKGPTGNKNSLQVSSFSCWLHKAPRLQRRVLGPYWIMADGFYDQAEGNGLVELGWKPASLRMKGKATPTAEFPPLSCINK